MLLRRLIPFVLLAALTAATSANADPAVTFDRPCYQDTYAKATAVFRASGLPPDTVVHVSLDGTSLGVARTDASGSVSRTVAVPVHSGSEEESQHLLVVATDDGYTAAGTMYTSALTAGFTPTRGDARTLRVRFAAYGMNLLTPSSVYLHYVAPDGKLRTTVALGPAQGPCGHVIGGKQRRLFPFTPRTGRWTLQFDTRPRYARGTDASKYPWATVGVRVPAARR